MYVCVRTSKRALASLLHSHSQPKLCFVLISIDYQTSPFSLPALYLCNSPRSYLILSRGPLVTFTEKEDGPRANFS